ncbi:hypothetical protein D3C79_649740 [compost metagenome]
MPEALQGRHVVGGQGRHRLLGVVGRRDEAAIPFGALEEEHLVGVHAVLFEGDVYAFRHCAEIFPDQQTLIAVGFERQDPQQIVDRIINVGPLGGGLSGRYPPQAQQGHHVVDAQRPAGTHVGTEQVHHRLIGRLKQLARVHRGQAPVLTERAQDVGWRADRGLGAVEIPVGPDLGGAFGDPHRQIPVDPHHHAGRLGAGIRLRQLFVRQELQVEIEVHILAVIGHPGRHLGVVIIAEGIGPHRPAPGVFTLGIEVRLQRIERRLLLQAVAAGGHETLKLGLAYGTQAGLVEHLAQDAELGLDDTGVVHALLGPQGGKVLLERRIGDFRLEAVVGQKLGHRLHVDVGQVQPATGGGAVGAGALRIGRIERMDGVQADEVGPPSGSLLDQLAEIAEVPHAPVVAAAQAIELHARAPHLATVGNGSLLVTGFGRDYEAHAGQRLVIALFQQGQLVIAQLGLHRQRHAIGLALHLFKFGDADQFTLDRRDLARQ